MSKFGRTTSLMSAGGYVGTLTNIFIGPLAISLPGSMLVDCLRVMSIVMVICMTAVEPNADAMPNVVLASKIWRRLTAPMFTLELSRLS